MASEATQEGRAEQKEKSDEMLRALFECNVASARDVKVDLVAPPHFAYHQPN